MKKPIVLLTSIYLMLNLLLPTGSVALAQNALIHVDDSCSLADAIRSANQNQAVGGCEAGIDRDTIELDRNVSLSGTLPTITSIMILDGNGHTISGNGGQRIFEVTAGSLALIDITLTNGASSSYGGAVWVDGGNLIVRNSHITNSNASQGGGAIGISNGTASVSLGSTLAYNRAHRGGAVWVGQSGRFFSERGLSIVNNAAAGTGGGIFNQGTVQIIGPGSIERNTASGRGGGIMSRGGTVILESGGLRVANNSAAGGGGISLLEGANLTAIYGLYVGNNRATNGGGGGIGVDHSTLRLAHATVESNNAMKGGGIWGTSASIAVDNTVFQGNTHGCTTCANGYDIYAEHSTLTVDGLIPVNRPGIGIYP